MISRSRLVPSLVVVVALVAGGLGAHELFPSGAAVTKTATAADRAGVLQAKAHSAPAPAEVPFLGPFKVGNCGPSIKAMDSALIRLKVRKSLPASCYGKATAKQVAAFQKRIHYKPTGRYTLVTHLAVVKRHGYTAAARDVVIARARHNYVLLYRSTVQRVSAHIALVGGTTLPYCQSSSRQILPAWPRIPPCTDCSGMAIFIEYQSGAGPQVGYFGPGSPVGWTGTLAVQGVHVAHGAPLQPGDLVLYPSSSARGPPWGHVAVVVGHGLVISHGSRGVKLLPYNYRPVGDVRRLVY